MKTYKHWNLPICLDSGVDLSLGFVKDEEQLKEVIYIYLHIYIVIMYMAGVHPQSQRAAQLLWSFVPSPPTSGWP
jgi:hypothetical protein